MTDYSDLVKRLRRDGIAARDTLKCVEMAPTVDPEDALEAADAIEAQAKRIEELEAALKPFADAAHFKVTKTTGTVIENSTWEIIVKETDLRQARKALGEKE